MKILLRVFFLLSLTTLATLAEANRVPTQVGAYEPLPGNLALPLSSERGLHEVTHWLGKRIDPTGLIHMGGRDFNPATGRFISPDPYGHFGSWDLYSYANGNPIAYCDPTGRIATGFHQGAIKGDYFEAANTAQRVGKFLGQVGVGFVPWVGQAADIRDITAAWNVGRTQGWSFGTNASLAMAGVAVIPGLGDAFKAGVKPLFGKPSSALADVMKGRADLMTGRLGGKLYETRKLQQLGAYLERRGFKLRMDGDDIFPDHIAGAFKASTREIILRSSPTQMEVWHELSHFRQFQALGPEKYLQQTRPMREQFVFDLLENSPRRWEALTPQQRSSAIDYIYNIGGIR